jgi:hypothetical protein
MAQANRISTTKLSDMIRDPIVQRAFQCAEAAYGQHFTVHDDLDGLPELVEVRHPRILQGGAVERVRELEMA